MLSRLSPRHRTVILWAAIGGLMTVAVGLAIEVTNFPETEEVSDLGAMAFQTLMALNLVALITSSLIPGSDIPLNIVHSIVAILANAFFYAALAWLLWPVVQKAKAFWRRVLGA